MGIIPQRVHRVLDFVVVAVFAIAPSVLYLVGNTRLLSYALAAVHLVLTLLTRGTTGRGVVPQRVHGIIELVVGVALLAVPFLRHWSYAAGRFYPAMGAVILVTWALSRYHDEPARVGPTAATV